MRPWLLVVLLVALLLKSSECAEKRSAMGGSAFGSLDRIPLSYLRKFYRQKEMKRDENELQDYPRDSEMPYGSISFWPLY